METRRRGREVLPDTNVPGWTPAPRVMDASNARLVNRWFPFGGGANPTTPGITVCVTCTGWSFLCGPAPLGMHPI